ncbi:MAG: CvpA family protein [Candidatus Polarisedimenticolaceae bacterium]|nr:CvpA family protein [Candidatus Polarisedimenticolaceae bacterium]
MIWVDYIIIGIIATSTLVSLIRGFAREALSLASWFISSFIAWTFFRDLAPHLAQWITTPSVRLGIAFAVLLVVSLLIGGLINFLIAKLIDMTGLSGTDRMIGMLFGALRGVLLVIIIVALAGLTLLASDPWWDQSTLIPYFQEFAIALKAELPDDIAKYFNY